ncbi:carbohydrate ABC transporter permease [Paraburkholderia dinghuensis]|uniref:Carbohydrate ABC transporter permease n=1 Tax=Paraburkholderia dinghuensis TaxID=2305225 RepID=A0A3N6Q2M4_9BURK|nr:carbohydrate ABC transporter permease [Paraburkholderia dinghuensis]RQH06536.1 carbohydrate ABC transporter permease [Paraburkholderia dinghuensis]
MKQSRNRARYVGYAIVSAGAVLMFSPFYFMFVFATHSSSEIFSMPPPLWFGNAFLDNMASLMRHIPFWRNLGWSLYTSVLQTLLTLLVTSMAGYAFAMYEFRFKKTLFAVALTGMLVPPFLSMIPTFMTMDLLGWINQPRALYVPGAAAALGVFLMRQYIASAIPSELVEAARIDGCSELRIYWTVVLPLLGPALGTLGLISFIQAWNNFLSALVVLRSPSMYTLPLALRILQSPTNSDWGAVMAGSAVAVLPLLILFAFTSRRLIDGMTAGAVKA